MNEEYLYSINQELWYVPEDKAQLTYVKVLEVSMTITDTRKVQYYVLSSGKTILVAENRLFDNEIDARTAIEDLIG